MTPAPQPTPDLLLLSRALEECVVGVLITDVQLPGHPIIYANPAFERLSGYAAGEILGQNCRFLQGQDRDQPGIAEIRQAMAQERSTTVILRNYRKDGTLFCNELSLSPVHDASGTLTHYLGFQNDVTVREEARQQLTSTLERVTDSFVSFDRNWTVSYINPAAAALVGRPPSELIGQPLFTLFPSALQHPIGHALQQAMDTATVQQETGYSAILGRWLETRAYPSEDGISLMIRDVTEVHRAQEEQRAAEERFSRIFQACPISITVSRDSDGRFIDVNPAFLRDSGYLREDVIGRTALDLKLWVDPQERVEIREILRRQGQILDREVKFRRRSGAVADTVVSIMPIVIGGETCVVTLIRDFTLEKQARQELEDSEQRYRRVAAELQRTLDLSLDMITTIGLNAEVVTVSAACERILGYTAEELIGRSYLDFVHPDDRPMTAEEGASIASRGRAGQHTATVVQNRYIHKDGHEVWLEWNAAAVPGEPLLYGVARDISERRAAQEDQAFLAAIVQASHDAILGVTLDGVIRSWNSGAEELYGYSAQAAVGQATSLIVPPDLLAEEEMMLRRIGQGERIEPFETVRIAQDGRPIPVLITVSPILTPDGRVVGASKIAQDISARQAAEREIKALNDDLTRQITQISSLREIDQAIASGSDPTATLGLILENILQQLGADAATALILNPHTLSLEYAATRGLHATTLQGSAIELAQGPAGRVALSRQPLTVPDLRTVLLAPDWHDLLGREGVTSYYAAPLIARGQVVGVIEVLHQRPFVPSPRWLEAIEALIGQAAIAVENAQLFQELEHRNLELRLAYDETIEGWARALDLRDKETEGHSRRVTEMTVELCRRLGVPPEEIVHVRRGALLHDIGKMGIRDAVLLKPGKLDDDEWAQMKLHPGYAVKLLAPIRFLQPALDIPHYHHEKWDGNGYPLGLKDTAIPLTARAFAVVDVYDALTSERPYRQAWSREQAIEHIQSSAGTHFDPGVVQVFIHMLRET